MGGGRVGGRGGGEERRYVRDISRQPRGQDLHTSGGFTDGSNLSTCDEYDHDGGEDDADDVDGGDGSGGDGGGDDANDVDGDGSGGGGGVMTFVVGMTIVTMMVITLLLLHLLLLLLLHLLLPGAEIQAEEP